MMATVIPPSSGRLRLLGRNPSAYGPRKEIRRRLGYLPQNLGYYPGFTVVEFVEYFALLKDMPAARVPGVVATAVERVGLGDKARSKLRALSGGMLRRVGIAQAIVNEPELLLLDEPTAGLDPEQRVAFRELLRDFGQRATVIVSTHLVEDVGAACTQVALMDQGRIVFHGTPDEVTARPRWAGQLATWAATTCWAIVAYLGCVAVVYGITARQATGGGALWWPVAVGVVGVAASCALGFAVGALFPSRFSAPLVAVAVFLAL